MNDTIYRQMAIDMLHGYFDGMLETDTICPKDIYNLFEIIPSAQPERKGYTKADYIMALHKEYGVDFARAEEAHNRALEYLQSTAMLKG